MNRPRAALCALALAGAPTALARAETPLARAKTNFAAGAQAYAAGNFAGAVQAFEAAYRLEPRPPILFSLAQAERRLYFIDKDPALLARAAAHFRQYVGEVGQGGRVADAAQALAELEIVGATSAPGAPAAATARRATRVMVVPSVEGARVLLDGRPIGDGRVAPGRHSLRVSADGYHDETRELTAVEGELVALDVALRERPARLAVEAPAGADVLVDGRPMGESPLPAPVEVPAGRHLLAVARPGHEAHARELELARGDFVRVRVRLARTPQRVASYVATGAGVACLGAGALLLLAAGGRQADARVALEALEGGRNLTADELADYRRARADRDALRGAGFVGLGVGGVLAAGGLLLFALDGPALVAPTPSREAPRPAPPRPAPAGLDAVSIAPLVGPLGLGLRGTF